MALVIGMNSGSSFDGIDAVLFEITLGADGQPTRPRFIDGLAYDWPPEVEASILPLFEGQGTLYRGSPAIGWISAGSERRHRSRERGERGERA